MILYNSRGDLFGDGTIIQLLCNSHGRFGHTCALGYRKLDSRSRLRWYTIYLIWFRIDITISRRGRRK